MEELEKREKLLQDTEQDGKTAEREKKGVKLASGLAVTNSAQMSTQEAAVKFAKPDTYTGNRKLYDSGAAKRNAKMDAFQSGEKVVDPYTGDTLTLTKAEAKLKYGEDWQRHLAESDHVKPLEQVYTETKGRVWNTTDDIKDAANSSDNIKVISRKTNNAKRSKTNEELVKDEKYLNDKDVRMSEEGKQRAIKDAEKADHSIRKQLNATGVQNVAHTYHEAGKAGAASAGTMTAAMTGIRNMVAVIKGEKDVEEAVVDIVEDTGKAAASGYVMSGGLTVVSHTLSGSSSKFLQALSESNVPGKVVTAVTTMGGTIKRYVEGEISTQECLIELGDTGLTMAATGYSMTVGQALIPIPVVGAAVGALVGSALTSGCFRKLMAWLQEKGLEHEERQRIIAECNEAAEQLRAYRKELESYLESYFKEYRDCFDEALSDIQMAFQMGDADGVIAGANRITRKLGGEVYYETAGQFKEFLNSDLIDVL